MSKRAFVSPIGVLLGVVDVVVVFYVVYAPCCSIVNCLLILYWIREREREVRLDERRGKYCPNQ